MPVKTTAAASGNAAKARISSNICRSVRRGRQSPRQRVDIIVEERKIVGGGRQVADGWRDLHHRGSGPPGEQLRGLLRLERLVQGHAPPPLPQGARKTGHPGPDRTDAAPW